jgi:hypothetical protein
VERPRSWLALAGLLGSSAYCSFALDFDGYSVRAPADAGESDAAETLVVGSARPRFRSYWFDRGPAVFSVPAEAGLLSDVAAEQTVAPGSFSSSAGGALELAADGSFQYTPPGAAFWGDDYFEYALAASPAAKARVRFTLRPPAFSLAELADNPAGGFGVSGARALDLAGYGDVAVAGDVNGDGLEDFLIGSLGPSQEQTYGILYGVGRSVYVVFGKRDPGPIALADISLGTSSAGFAVFGDGNDTTLDSFGATAAAAGDVNGDGLDDIIIGSLTYDPIFDDPSYDYTQANDIQPYGAAYVVFGKRDGAPVQSSDLRAGRGGGFVILSNADPLYFTGNSVHSAGDVNGDGLDDVIVGVAQAGEDLHGAAYVVLGKIGSDPVLLSELAAGGPSGFRIEGTSEDLVFGFSVSGVGDLNGDGLADVVATAPAYPSVERQSGRAVVLFGRRETTSLSVADIANDPALGFIATGADPGDYVGMCSAAGDVNGDGLDDFILGSTFGSLGPPAAEPADAGVSDGGVTPEAEGGDPQMGIAYAVFGSRAPASVDLRELEDSSSRGFSVAGTDMLELLGRQVSAGDLNGDGLGDLIATTPASPIGSEGYLIFGSTSPAPLRAGLSSVSSEALLVLRFGGAESAGEQIRSGADFNGDGIDDLLISAPQYSDAPQAAGGAYVVFGWDMTGALTGRDRALIGGAGDDIFELPAEPVVIVRGGRGVDTLRANAAAQIDLTLPGRFESIEVIDLRGGGPQTLLLDDAALRRVPGNQSGFAFNLARRLSVLGDAEDTLQFDRAGYTARGGVAGRSVYGREGYYYGLEVSQELQLQPP